MTRNTAFSIVGACVVALAIVVLMLLIPRPLPVVRSQGERTAANAIDEPPDPPSKSTQSGMPPGSGSPSMTRAMQLRSALHALERRGLASAGSVAVEVGEMDGPSLLLCSDYWDEFDMPDYAEAVAIAERIATAGCTAKVGYYVKVGPSFLSVYGEAVLVRGVDDFRKLQYPSRIDRQDLLQAVEEWPESNEYIEELLASNCDDGMSADERSKCLEAAALIGDDMLDREEATRRILMQPDDPSGGSPR